MARRIWNCWEAHAGHYPELLSPKGSGINPVYLCELLIMKSG